MPDCKHRSAVCVVGDYWQCKEPGCVNGPPRPAVKPEPDDEPDTIPGVGQAWYVCVACTTSWYAGMQDVAGGAKCPCGGMLWIEP